ncbi:hypothetical protein GCM10022393_20550 [Aquimarina addita]|uniref:Uncharacterized protein n=1 Tax=Aquimarina addita TaxID=870485 RepID=A0ABP6UL75_9FLAO
MKHRNVYIWLVVLLFSWQVDAQCAMCRAVLESEEGQKTAQGVNDGIVYLMIIPYVLIGIVGYFIYRSIKSQTKKQVDQVE